MPALADYPADAALADPSAWAALDAQDGYGRLEALARAAAARDVLDALPESVDAAREGDYSARARVIGERLWLLGYAASGRDRARSWYERDRPGFLAAVVRFQLDAGLSTDAWVGPATWSALEQLLKFEGGPLPEAWIDSEHWSPALLRAAQLRLATLGLGARKPTPGFTQPSQPAIRRFHRMLRALRLVDDDRGSLLDVDTLALLLDQDRLVAAVADLALVPDGEEEQHFRFYQTRAWKAGEHREQVRQFLVQLVKVELWLLGLDVAIASTADYPVFRFGVLRPRRRPDRHEIGRALLIFHEQMLGLSAEEAVRRSAAITPELFRALVDGDGAGAARPAEGVEEEDESAHALVAERLQDQDAVDAALVEGRSIGMRIWDGMKRLWRWFRRRVVQIVEIGSNLARIFYRYAAKGIQILGRATRAVIESVAAWTRGRLDLGDTRVYIGADFDLEILVPAHPNDVQAGTRLGLFGHRFLFACRVLRLVLSGVVLGSMQRWARFAHALVRNLAELIELYREIQRAEAVLGGHA